MTVEISDKPYLYQGWDGWTFKGAGAKDISIDEATGIISYTYSTNRAPYLQMTKDVTLYSLPDTVGLTFNSTMPIENVQIDARNRLFDKSNYMKISPENGAATFETGVDHTIRLDLEALGGTDNLETYPITIKNIKFTLIKNGTVGDHTLAIKSFYSHYPNIEPALPTGDVNSDGEVNIADVNTVIKMILLNIQPTENGDVNHDGEVNIADINAIISIILN